MKLLSIEEKKGYKYWFPASCGHCDNGHREIAKWDLYTSGWFCGKCGERFERERIGENEL